MVLAKKGCLPSGRCSPAWVPDEALGEGPLSGDVCAEVRMMVQGPAMPGGCRWEQGRKNSRSRRSDRAGFTWGLRAQAWVWILNQETVCVWAGVGGAGGAGGQLS